MATITMKDSCINSIEQIKFFLKLDQKFQFNIASKKQKYKWIAEALTKFRYHGLRKKKERGIVRKYIQRVARISSAQLTRLIKKHKKCGLLVPNYAALKRNGFKTIYSPTDIALLIKTDVAHKRLSGQATKVILKREYKIFHKEEYKNIAKISVSRIYDIRKNNRQYNSSKARLFKRTQAVQVSIGVRRKPEPQGCPGFVRVDTVHQGDHNKEKGVYHLNIVDEVTQWEMIATVEAISEHFLTPVIEMLLKLFPFRIFEFHADNGSEFINKVVAKLLAKLYVKLTKSRARHSNDNALVESKNGSIIRKLYGRNFIHRGYAPAINAFNKQYVNIYLNYHRPCGFATEYTDKRGKIKKKYKNENWMTPYDKLKSLPNAVQYLKAGFTFEELDKIAYAMSDNEFAEEMMKAKAELFKKLH